MRIVGIMSGEFIEEGSGRRRETWIEREISGGLQGRQMETRKKEEENERND